MLESSKKSVYAGGATQESFQGSVDAPPDGFGHKTIVAVEDATSSPLQKAELHQAFTLWSQLSAIFLHKLNLFLVFLPIALVSGLLHWAEHITFLASFLAMMPLAALIGYSSEQVSLRTNPVVAGLLNASFGNAVELIFGLVAVTKGVHHPSMLRFAQATLVGSMLSNTMLVMGSSMLVGGLKFPTQSFSRQTSKIARSMLLFCAFFYVLPVAVSNNGLGKVIAAQELLYASRYIALICVGVYAAYLVFQLKTHQHLFDEGDEDEEKPEVSLTTAVLTLAVATAMVSILSDFMTDSVETAASTYHVSHIFIAVMLVPIVGNAAEHYGALSMALKNKMDLSIAISTGSAVQIGLFVFPALVLWGWAVGANMSLVLHGIDSAVIFVSVILANVLLSGGNSTYLDGAILIAAYAVIGLCYWF